MPWSRQASEMTSVADDGFDRLSSLFLSDLADDLPTYKNVKGLVGG